MASQITIFSKTKTIYKILSPIKSISTFSFLPQQPELATDDATTPLPPNPATGSPVYSENWRNPFLNANPNAIMPVGFLNQNPNPFQVISQKHDLNSLLNLFAKFTATQRWNEMKQLFEMWVRSLDKNGKPNKPDVNLYNHYLRANLMRGASAADLLDLVAQMEDFAILPNTASFNMVLKAMYLAGEALAAEKLIQRMEESGKESQPDDESFNLVVSMLLHVDQVDAAMKYIDKTLKYGHMVSTSLFTQIVTICVNRGRLDLLVSVIEKCKTDQNKALSPPWNLCYYLAEVAIEEDNSKLAFYALEFMARWIASGENARSPVLLSVDEGLIVSALVTAGRTYSSTLLDASWAILRRSLHQRKAPNPESYIAKISAYASLGNLPKAFSALREFETAYENSEKEVPGELFSPFTSLYPLVVACSKKGFETLDLVYLQLENLSRSDRPYKSVAALNCVILGCANIWDLDRAYQTFEAISSPFGLTPDIHSYNALMYAFGKLKKTFEASRVFEHLVSVGVQPNAMSYSLLVDAHLINRDAKAALNVIDDMVSVGFEPYKGMLKKVRRRCVREMDYESDDRVDSLARRFKIQMGSENRRDTLFSLQYGSQYNPTDYAS